MSTDLATLDGGVLIPLSSLRVPASFEIGGVVLHPSAIADELIDRSNVENRNRDWVTPRVREVLDHANDGCIAYVRDATNIDDAIDSVRAALDCLRLFHLSRREWETAAFGLPGDVYQAPIHYVALEGDIHHGATFFGGASGLDLTTEDVELFGESLEFGFLSDALSRGDTTEGRRRARVGTQLFGRAALEHRPDLKMLGLVSALEAWLIERDERGAQTLRLARHVSWFGCGAHNNASCGRRRPICPYLHLKPESKTDRTRLSLLRDLGNEHTAWRCSEPVLVVSLIRPGLMSGQS